MHSSDFFRKLIETEITGSVYKELSAEPVELYEPIRYMLSIGGKRMRPALLLMGTELFGGDYLKSVPAALAIEVFHNFTLLHDDIMDNAPLRRSKETVYKKWNANIAILSGDAMMIKSYELIMNTENAHLPAVLNVFNKTALEVCEGQQLDMNFEKRNDVSIKEYIHMITLKTSVLLGASLKIGAILANAPEKEAEHIYSFGKNTGIAFQLQDDILDVYGDSHKFGKQTGGDILCNKKTYLLVKALELAKGTTAVDLKHWLSVMPAESKDQQEKVSSVKEIYNRLGVRELCENKMNHYYEIALKELNSIHVDESRKKYLKDFADQLMVREY